MARHVTELALAGCASPRPVTAAGPGAASDSWGTGRATALRVGICRDDVVDCACNHKLKRFTGCVTSQNNKAAHEQI